MKKRKDGIKIVKERKERASCVRAEKGRMGGESVCGRSSISSPLFPLSFSDRRRRWVDYCSPAAPRGLMGRSSSEPVQCAKKKRRRKKDMNLGYNWVKLDSQSG